MGRKERLSWLIRFINDNAVLGKVRNFEIVSKLILTHMVMLRCLKKAGKNLLQMQKNCMLVTNYGYITMSFLSMLSSFLCRKHMLICICSAGATHSVLNEAIFAYMGEAGDAHHEDIVRAFFRYKVGDIGSLLSHIMETTRKSAYELGRSLSASLPEANGIVLVSYMKRKNN